MLDNVPQLTVKSWSNTRWESRVKSVQAIRLQTSQIRLALKALEEASTDDPKSISEAQSLVSALENFEFLFGLVIWDRILFTINKVSKRLQSKIVSMDTTLKHIEGVISYFKKFRDDGFTTCMDGAKTLASKMEIEPKFATKRQVKRQNILMNGMMKMRKYNSLLWNPLE